MSEGGYTLAETLAALLIIGLAFGGLTEGVQVIGLVQSATARTTADISSRWAAQDAMNQLLNRRGPFRSDDPKTFIGGATRFSFDCGESRACGAGITTAGGVTRLVVDDTAGDATAIPLPQVSSASFSYGDAINLNENWPPAPGERRLLKSVFLMGQSPTGAVPLVATRIWREHEAGCRFDPIAEDCRAVAR